MENKITLTLDELKQLLDDQRELVIERLKHSSSQYNNKSTEGQLFSMDINEKAFVKVGKTAKYPQDYEVLKKYLK